MSRRYLIVAITSMAALWMYIDRVCFSTLADTIKQDLDISDKEKSYVLGAFFLTYGLFQIPMGALADRFGARVVLALSIAAWSLVTASTGFTQSIAALLVVRLLLGITEAGAYPAAAGLVKRWARPEERGRFSSAVALGGRVGGAVAPFLTATLATVLVGVAVVELVWTPPAPAIALSAGEAARGNWRGVFVIYGLCGLIVAALFWLIIRDRPPGSPSHFQVDRPLPGSTSPPAQLQFFGKLARSLNMWFFGGVQFGVNIGWAFLVTLFPTYLKEEFHLSLEEIGRMQTVTLITGCCGMFFGGFVTDWLRSRFGPRYGRSVPIGITLGGCAIIFFTIPVLGSPWIIVVALGFMAFCVDLHNPSIWSFAQDVGGRNVGAALGWGNMWGNIGAAVSPVLLTAIWGAFGWNMVFIWCGISFALASMCGLMLNATIPVDPRDR